MTPISKKEEGRFKKSGNGRNSADFLRGKPGNQE
jgi:hypothetical protein